MSGEFTYLKFLTCTLAKTAQMSVVGRRGRKGVREGGEREGEREGEEEGEGEGEGE